MSSRSILGSRLWLWLVPVCAFYGIWGWLALGQGRADVVAAHWPIAAAMALGSYVAGSTPMGGGTVGFPILVLLFELPSSLGRDFSFAIQSVGMTSASLFILARRQPLAGRVLAGSMAGSLVGLPLGLLVFSDLLSDLWVKLLFSVMWASFGALHLYRTREFARLEGMLRRDPRLEYSWGALAGCLAGLTVTAAAGVGVDMVVYAVLVLLCRADLKIAIPTSVIIMAFNSLLGLGLQLLTGGLQPGVFEHWLAAAPVVCLGAPLGALVVSMIGRTPTLLFVAVLCLGQFGWTCYNERAALGVAGTALAIAAVGLCLFAMERLRRIGMRPPAPGGAYTAIDRITPAVAGRR